VEIKSKDSGKANITYHTWVLEAPQHSRVMNPRSKSLFLRTNLFPLVSVKTRMRQSLEALSFMPCPSITVLGLLWDPSDKQHGERGS